MVYIYNKVLSALKKNEIIIFPAKWIEPENILLGDINQTQEIKGLMFPLICGS